MSCSRATASGTRTSLCSPTSASRLSAPNLKRSKFFLESRSRDFDDFNPFSTTASYYCSRSSISFSIFLLRSERVKLRRTIFSSERREGEREEGGGGVGKNCTYVRCNKKEKFQFTKPPCPDPSRIRRRDLRIRRQIRVNHGAQRAQNEAQGWTEDPHSDRDRCNKVRGQHVLFREYANSLVRNIEIPRDNATNNHESK